MRRDARLNVRWEKVGPLIMMAQEEGGQFGDRFDRLDEKEDTMQRHRSAEFATEIERQLIQAILHKYCQCQLHADEGLRWVSK